MENFNKDIGELYANCKKIISSIHNNRKKFINVYDSPDWVVFEDSPRSLVVNLTSTEMSLRYKNISLYYYDNIVQLCSRDKHYIVDLVYIPSSINYSFYSLDTDEDLFQLSTIIDIKWLTLDDIRILNRVREYFYYRFLKNNI